MTHAPGGVLESETFTSGPFNGVTIDATHDDHYRLTGVAIPGILSHSHGYDLQHGRLTSTSDGTHNVTTNYVTNADLVETLLHAEGTHTRLTTTRDYDSANRLDDIHAIGADLTTISRFTYTHDAAGRRTRADLADGTAWHYGYNSRGEVTSAERLEANLEPWPGQAFGYTFDGLGNRLETQTNERPASYTPNALNQYESREVPPYRDLRGSAHSDATVSIGGVKAARGPGGAFHHAVPLDNTTGPVHAPLTILGVLNHAGPNGEDVVSEEAGEFFLPADPETFVHDLDGNLTQDGRWTYEWNADNRLIAMETRSDLPATLLRKRIEMAYDYQGRRVAKTVLHWDEGTTSFHPQETTHFLYHGWKLLAELDETGAPVRTHLWGHDVTGTFEGAGTIGGLLATTAHGANTTSWFMAYDGNGNIAAAVNTATGQVEARFEYGAFGDEIVTDGPATGSLPFRFSTKYTDNETGLLYYGFRYYDPVTGRWPSRDPMEEGGGLNIYRMVGNDSVNHSDLLGLFKSPNITGDLLVYGARVAAYQFARLAIDSGEFSQRLLHNYVWGNGTDFNLTKTQVRNYLRPLISLDDNSQFASEIVLGEEFSGDYTVVTADYQNPRGGLGAQYEIRTSVEVTCITDDLSRSFWRAEGTATVFDLWDFNVNWGGLISGNTPRGRGGEWRTILGSLIPGDEFEIRSDEVEISQRFSLEGSPVEIVQFKYE